MFGKKFHVAIMGSGNIAGIMADTLNKMSGVKLYAVASRSQIKADAFARKYGCKKAYGSYEELVLDKKVDLIYIATPHSEHYENARLCILNGKPVLCEKSFTVNAQQAEELISLAREKEVLIAEAMWTRYMPMRTKIQEVLGSGIIGDLKTLTANLGYSIAHIQRLQDPELAGGALLDVGVYTLNFASMIFGNSIESVDSVCTYTESGVDAQNSITLRYSDGKVAVLNSSMESQSDRRGVIYGTKGFVVIDNINNYEAVHVYDSEYRQIASYKRPKQISGYEYEVEACMKAIKNKELECAQMPHSETMRIMKQMDEMRNAWGIVYPFEDGYTEEKLPEEGEVKLPEIAEEVPELAEISEAAEAAEGILETAEEAETEAVLEMPEEAETEAGLETV